MGQLLWFLTEIAVASVIAIGLVAVLRTHQDSHFVGLRAAVVGYLTYRILFWILAALGISPSLSTLLIFVGPAIEESTRLAFGIHARAMFVGRRQVLSFAVGYASFEVVLKLIDIGFEVAAGRHIVAMILPLVAGSMLVAVGVVAGAWIARGRPWWMIIPVTFAIHAWHNWSAIERLGSGAGVGELVQFSLWRIGIFVVLGALVLREMRFAPVTNPLDRASTPP